MINQVNPGATASGNLARGLKFYISSLAFVSLVLFLSAGTLKFRNGWLYIAAMFIPMLFALAYMVLKDPDMLQKRTRTKEMRKPQKLYQVLSLAIVLVTYVIPGLDYRFHWSEIPVWLVGAATAVMLISYLGFFAVMVQNSYASRVIEIQEGQKLIDTGLYSVVRHPMYLCGTFLYLASPLVLGSYYGLIPALFIPVVLVIRIINEEKMLKTELKGYEDFMKKVRYRIIPFIW